MLEIEFSNPAMSECDCCGNTTVRLTRFVYKDGDAFGVYYAAFTAGHSEKILSGLIGLGEWGDDNKGPETRRAFPFRIWMNGNNFQLGLTDAEEFQWSDVTFLGKILDREEALAHEWIKDVFHITDHMVTDDEEIVRYFSEGDA